MLLARLLNSTLLRLAVRRVLSEPRFAARAEEIAFWGRSKDGAVAGAILVERYVGR
jgi:UDP:flavonoid glycosyltransferase YjiC (YdhE family)